MKAVNGVSTLQQGWNFLTFPDYDEIFIMGPRLFRGSGGMRPKKSFKIRILRLPKSEFHRRKFPDFSNFVVNSLTF